MLNPERVLLVHPLGYNTAARCRRHLPPDRQHHAAARDWPASRPIWNSKAIGAAIIDCFAHPDSDSKILDHIDATARACSA